ncbi:MAG: hypothetical protein AB4062_18985 [Crocosphaera sp.]
MEPTILTASAIATLAFTKAFEKTVEKFTDSAWKRIDDLRKMVWDKVKSQFQGDADALSALEGAAEGSKDDLETVGDYLKIIMKKEPEFSKQIQNIAGEINKGKRGNKKQQIQINRDQAKGMINNVEGGENQIAMEINNNRYYKDSE